MSKFHEGFDELKARVTAAGCQGEWQDKPNGVHRFCCKDGSGLNWSATKGTIWYAGPNDAKNKLQAAVEGALGSSPPAAPASKEGAGHIFVVHGHDEKSREQLELVLHKFGLEPFVLQNTSGGGLTIIESLEKMIGKEAKSSFGIVLLTPDDMGYAKKEGETSVKPRARQNVILEMGMLLASLTRERVAILAQGYLEHPSDVAGILYIGFNDHVKEAVPKLVGRLQQAGIALDPTKITLASS